MVDVKGLAPKHYQITAEGMKSLQNELANLKKRRREITQNIQEITSQSTDIGAWADSTFVLNQGQANELDGEIELLERIIGMAEVIEKPPVNSHVQIGSQVVVNLDGHESTYVMVSPVEANPEEGKISNESPLGMSLLGKKVHERFEVHLPTRREIQGEIKSIG